MNALLAHLIDREEGQDLLECALLAALLSIVSVLSLQALGPVISDVWPRFQAILSSV